LHNGVLLLLLCSFAWSAIFLCFFIRQLEAQRRKERTEAHLYMAVQVLLDDAFDGYQGNDLYDPDKVQFR
jgi:hypothetical protein